VIRRHICGENRRRWRIKSLRGVQSDIVAAKKENRLRDALCMPQASLAATSPVI